MTLVQEVAEKVRQYEPSPDYGPLHSADWLAIEIVALVVRAQMAGGACLRDCVYDWARENNIPLSDEAGNE